MFQNMSFANWDYYISIGLSTGVIRLLIRQPGILMTVFVFVSPNTVSVCVIFDKFQTDHNTTTIEIVNCEL